MSSIQVRYLAKYCTLSILLFLHSVTVRADYSSSLFSLPLFSVETNNLLPNKEILKLAQDEQGFIWVGTRTGVYRFDGYQYEPLLATNNEINLANIHVRSLVADGNTLWIGSMTQGLFKVNLNNSAAVQYKAQDNGLGGNQVNGLKRDSAGHLWIAHSFGLDRLDITSETFTHFGSLDNPTDRYFNYLLDLELDDNGNIWVATAKGIAYLSLDSNEQLSGFRILEQKGASVKDIVARRLFRASDGRIWVGTQRQGIYLINPAILHVTKLEELDENQPRINTSIAESKTKDGAPAQIWISGYDGVQVRDAITTEVVHSFKGNLLDEFGLKSDTVYPLLTSRSGLIWLGVNQHGLQFFAPDTQQYKVLNRFNIAVEPVFSSFIQNVIKMNEHSILVLNSDKPYRVNLETGEVAPFFTTPEYKNSSVVGGVLNDDSTYWLGSTDGTIIKTDSKGKVLTELTLPLNKNQGVFVYTLVKGQNDELWIGTDRGLVKLDLASERLSAATVNGQPFIAFVRSLYVDRKNRLWAGTTSGVNVINSGELNATLFTTERGTGNTLTNDYIVQVTETVDGHLIIYTRGGLFKLVSEQDNEIRVEPYARELFDGVVLEEGILPTNDGGLLVGAGKKINQQGELLFSLSEKDGNIVGGRGKAFLQLSDEYYLYATSHAVTIFTHELNSTWDYNAPLAITSAEVDDISMNIDPSSPSLVLKADNTEFAIRFTALDFTQPERNQYRYKLIGYEDTWSTTPWDIRQVRYTGLPPGDYQLQLQGSNRNSLWTTPPKTISVTVLPKFYQTLWFKSFALILSLALIYVLFRWRLNLAKQKQLRILEQKQAIERAEMMSDLMNQKNQHLAEVTHDLRTPLSLLKMQLEGMQDGVLTADEKSYDRMQKRIANLNQLVGDIYQISVADSQTMKLNKKPVDIVKLLDDTMEAYQPLLQQKQLSLTVTNRLPENASVIMSIDEGRIIQVFGNLLKNSSRYTDSGGQVNVTLEKMQGESETLCICFEDSAPAVDESELTKLFERSYRAPSNKNHSHEGSGLGLWICRTIVAEHHGDIQAKLSPLGGLAIIISLSLS